MASPLNGTAPLTVTFTNTTTGEVDNYEWAFGDGATSVLTDPTHIYTTTGVFTVTLTASRSGESDVETKPNYITVSSGDLGDLVTTTITYDYDPLYRLTSAAYSSSEVYTYTYDAVGNWLAMGTGGEVSTYTYDPANRLTSVDGVGYTWDNNGNLLDDGIRSFEYDPANRLIAVVSGTLTTTYTYNGDGHRMAKTENGVTTSYVVAVLGLSQVLVETTGGDSIVYLYGHDLLGEKDDTWQWHLGDGLGSVRQLIDSGGSVSLAQGYTPFGVPLWDEGGGTTGYGFTGERWEAYNQLLFLRARYYQPGTGRFISRDSWQGDIWQPSTLFRSHVYVRNNLINLNDPSGFADCSTWPSPIKWMCEQANAGDLNTIDLLYNSIVLFAYAQGGDKRLAAGMLFHYLHGNGNDLNLSWWWSSRIGKDANIVDATNDFLTAFIVNDVNPVSPGTEAVAVGPTLCNWPQKLDHVLKWRSCCIMYKHVEVQTCPRNAGVSAPNSSSRSRWKRPKA